MRLIPQGLARNAALAAHVDNIQRIGGDRAIWMPAFNYDFTTTGQYDVANSPSQVGVINEWFRLNVAEWRTPTPVFNFVGSGDAPDVSPRSGEPIDPFDELSMFNSLADLDGEIVWYGATLNSTTLIHHAETAAGGPPYRYDKRFSGVVVAQGEPAFAVDLNYHVRPRGPALLYDWPRLLADLSEAGIYVRSEMEGVASASARLMRDYWVERLHGDPLYLLAAESVAWVAPKLQELGRRFAISDFEGSQV